MPSRPEHDDRRPPWGGVRPPALIALLLLTTPIQHARPQGLEDLQPGMHVRARGVEPGAPWIEGTYLGRVADTLRVRQPPPGRPLAVAVGHLAGLQVSRGTARRTGHGALVGAAVGGGIGLALGIAALAEGGCNGGFPNTCIISPGTVALAAPLALGALGAGIGALAGSATHRELWAPVAGVGTNVSITPGGRGLRLAVRAPLPGPHHSSRRS